MNWYTLRVISGKEKKIKETILYDVSLTDLGDQIGDVLVPSENIVEMRDGKKKVRERVFFPYRKLRAVYTNSYYSTIFKILDNKKSIEKRKTISIRDKPSTIYVELFSSSHDGQETLVISNFTSAINC